MALGRVLVVFAVVTSGAFAAQPSRQVSEPAGQSSANGGYTIQVAAFPDDQSAERFAAFLGRMGERPVWGTVDLKAKGTWFRVFVGTFRDQEAARRYGKDLVSRGVVTEFMVKTADEIRLLGRPRTTYHTQPLPASDRKPEPAQNQRTMKVGGDPSHVGLLTSDHSDKKAGNSHDRTAGTPRSLRTEANSPAVALPIRSALNLGHAPRVDPLTIPRPSPIHSAYAFFAEGEPVSFSGGLWVTGDASEGLNRLRWIVGNDLENAVVLDADGKVQLNERLLAEAAGVSTDAPAGCPRIRELIDSNEGLRLLVQLVVGRHRYALHIGKSVNTFGGDIAIDGSVNLDNNYDSRINPYRKGRAKLDRERPAAGFDSLIAINPAARWFNLHTKRLVPPGNIAFHELAEAYGKVALGLQYLPLGLHPGAHDLALEREMLLKSQRPSPDNVVTVGSNRVFKSEDEARRFQAETRWSVGDQH
ncbi:MAG TPA: SPOR domain-containing protein [Blastocatellia bacterium]|nr:SPOR domain-containing protein [Blastocatellia bacterium]